MEATTDLIARARRALESTAAVALALAPLALQPAQAVTLDTGDLVVDKSGAYFYNSSGYFADWRGQPSGGTQVQANADGSTKFFGTASASAGQFVAHNCSTEWNSCGYDRGVAMVWTGTLASPAAVGDRLAINVDFTVTLPDVGGNWNFGARLGDYDFGSSNSLSAYGQGSSYGSISEAGTYRIHGVIVTDELQDWQIQPDAPTYWQLFVSTTANAPWGESYWSQTYQTNITPYRAVTLTVPNYSIDIAHVDASFSPGNLGLQVSAVPEPGTWLMMALGLGLLGAAGARRRH